MKTKEIGIELIDKDNRLKYSLGAILEYNEYNEHDDGELYFLHPFTGEQYTNPKDCFVGWSYQNEEHNEARQLLAEMICEDTDLMQKAWDLDTINYYL